jgi:hypothetical protein
MTHNMPQRALFFFGQTHSLNAPEFLSRDRLYGGSSGYFISLRDIHVIDFPIAGHKGEGLANQGCPF